MDIKLLQEELVNKKKQRNVLMHSLVEAVKQFEGSKAIAPITVFYYKNKVLCYEKSITELSLEINKIYAKIYMVKEE